MEPLERNELLDLIRELLAEHCEMQEALDGSTMLVSGDPAEVVVRVTGSTVPVSEYGLRWEGPHTPVVKPRLLGTLHWLRLRHRELAMLLERLVDVASENRQAMFGTCRYCGRTFGPEHMHDEDTCHGCAEKHLGVIH